MKKIVLIMVASLFFLFTFPLFVANNTSGIYRARIIQVQEIPKGKQQIQQIITAQFVNGLY